MHAPRFAGSLSASALFQHIGIKVNAAHLLALETSDLVEALDVLEQVGDVVGLRDGDLEDVGACN